MENEEIIKLLPWAISVLTVCVGVALAFLAVWVAAPAIVKIIDALERLVRLIRRTIASELRVKRTIAKSDLRALNVWIREADEAKARADQERSLRRQIASAEGRAQE